MSNNAGALSQAKALAKRQHVDYDAFPRLRSNGQPYDAGATGFRPAAIGTGRIDISRPAYGTGKAGSFPSPMAKGSRTASRDDLADQREFNVLITHSSANVADLAPVLYNFGHGMMMFSLCEVARDSPATTMVSWQGINHLLRLSFEYELQLIDNRLQGPSTRGDQIARSAEAAAEMGVFDSYDPEAASFGEPYPIVESKAPHLFVSQEEVMRRINFLGMWLAEGQPGTPVSSAGIGYNRFGDRHSEHYIKRNGISAVSTITMEGRYIAGTPNVIGPSQRDLMWLSLVCQRGCAPERFQSLDQYRDTEPMQLVVHASTRFHRPLYFTSDRDRMKWKAADGEVQFRHSTMSMFRFAGNKGGFGNRGAVIETVRAPGERMHGDVSNQNRKEYEPIKDRCQYAKRHIYSTREASIVTYTTLEICTAFAIGRIFDPLNGVQPNEMQIRQCGEDPSYQAHHRLASMGTFSLDVSIAPILC